MSNPYKRHGASLPALVIWIIIAALLLCFLVAGLTHTAINPIRPVVFWKGSYTSQEIKKDVALDGVHAVSISGSAADVRVTSSNDDQIHVDLKLPTDDKTSAANAVTISDGTLSISADTENHFFWFPWNWYPSSVTLALPAAYEGDFSIQTTSGDISLPDSLHLGALSIRHTSGDLEGGAITAASADIQSTSGEIHLQALDSPRFTIHQTSGNTTVNRLSGAGTFNRVSGDLEADIVSMSGNISSSSISGNTRFSLPAGQSANVRFGCVSGNIHSDYPLSFNDAHNASGAIGSAPSYTLSAQTTSGNIDLTKS
ncbi:DUF4097 family beta strand repeat-containing protein [Ethanoligenens harbinense]|uniref:DUF4097 domain-containing protein n=1 Tax=Ethanoligenens harbinense (strain DSM 18485 / JCM 12961 / CGMCC 1.5033 / YUAN-3) TaxID=663278 RepID=E6U523_ETHHY|nr:DUF4097 family beta strand repeat-containing protein [Ethanoligenens harbinense]ADU26729.1 hypothetical protein Ethha_1178 [Ethanoligenens harbinense YUAN-3]AVQ95838.1 hypothetical protein CXQ68_06080 [Ethanoligenens harbinense YUAN-3]AYF38499.1 hypothetical protein CXP51_05945 [Ethanoligenens harbinense]AYF41245.1 hypothetical protein CN246_06080 [Ethanoligenens harbinense]QCN92078.1 hypothetical protein DRA42_06100 [Ethanoligenens harbinense]